ncbi:MAG: hypothetical protein ICV61_13545 [Microcoleus sp. Co-bin12]|nr:hypothetical protein [Microcoleus sp. Co-bin12]
MAKAKAKGKRGGIRPGAGNPYKWKHRETKPVRLPIVLIPKILEIAKLIDGQEYINRVEHEFDDEEGKPKYYNGYYAAELSYLRGGNDALASEVRNLRRENEALKAQLMELNNGVLPEPLPDSSLLLVREPKPLAKQDRRKKRKTLFL